MERIRELFHQKSLLVRYCLLIYILISFFYHIQFALFSPMQQMADSVDYIGIGEEIAGSDYDPLKTPYARLPGYPFLLAALGVDKQGNNEILLGLVQQYLAWLCDVFLLIGAYLLTRDTRFTLLAGALSLLSWESYLFQQFIMTGPIYRFCLSGLLCFLVLGVTRAQWGALIPAQLFIIGALYLRPSAFPLALISQIIIVFFLLAHVFRHRSAFNLFSKQLWSYAAIFVLLFMQWFAWWDIQAPIKARAQEHYMEASTSQGIWWRVFRYSKMKPPLENQEFQSIMHDFEKWKSRVKQNEVELEHLQTEKAIYCPQIFEPDIIHYIINEVPENWRLQGLLVEALMHQRGWSYDKALAATGAIANVVFWQNLPHILLSELPFDFYNFISALPSFLQSDPSLHTTLYYQFMESKVFQGGYFLVFLLGMIFSYRWHPFGALVVLFIFFTHTIPHLLVAPEMIRFRYPVITIIQLYFIWGLWIGAKWVFPYIVNTATNESRKNRDNKLIENADNAL